MLGTKVGYVFRRHPGIILLLLFFITSEDSIKVLKKTYTINHTLVITSHHIETTDAGLDGLCIREIRVYHTNL